MNITKILDLLNKYKNKFYYNKGEKVFKINRKNENYLIKRQKKSLVIKRLRGLQVLETGLEPVRALLPIGF